MVESDQFENLGCSSKDTVVYINVRNCPLVISTAVNIQYAEIVTAFIEKLAELWYDKGFRNIKIQTRFPGYFIEKKRDDYDPQMWLKFRKIGELKVESKSFISDDHITFRSLELARVIKPYFDRFTHDSNGLGQKYAFENIIGKTIVRVSPGEPAYRFLDGLCYLGLYEKKFGINKESEDTVSFVPLNISIESAIKNIANMLDPGRLYAPQKKDSKSKLLCTTGLKVDNDILVEQVCAKSSVTNSNLQPYRQELSLAMGVFTTKS